MSKPRRALKVAGIVLAGFAVLFVVAAAVFDQVMQGKVDEHRAEMKAGLDKYKDTILADHAWLQTQPIFLPRPGTRDAGTMLNKRLGWGGQKVSTTSLGIPAALSDQMKTWKGEWYTHVDEADLTGVDLAWMTTLKDYDFWDLETESPLGAMRPYSAINAPLPDFVGLTSAARVRLLGGLKHGGIVAAAADVRELARLALTTETLLGQMVGLGLLKLEARAHEAAVARKIDVTGWIPFPLDDVARMKRALWVVQAVYSVLVPDEYRAPNSFSEKLVVGKCGGIGEALSMSLFPRSYLTPRHAARYAELGKVLSSSDCRLKQLRRVWFATDHEGELPLDGSAICGAGSSAFECAVPSFFIHLPFVKAGVGDMFLAVATPDWTSHYSKLPPN